MRLALFSAAVNGDNSGDALIESAIRRLLGGATFERLSLTEPPGEAGLALVNSCDAAIICGTNLYQTVFACGLTADIVERIRIPIVPFGVGASAAMGEIPHMDPAGVAAVRAIHRKCVVGSVRDEASRRFLYSIGVRNVALTGCPVLFHGLGCPDFVGDGEGITLAPRARLLHIDRRWEARQREALDLLCRRYKPKLVLQSPYDLALAVPLARLYGLDLVYDENWQDEPYVSVARAQRLSIGFRLHFAMLSIAYGKPAHLVSHDSRAAEFCRLLGLPVIPIDRYRDAALVARIDRDAFEADAVRRQWSELARQMHAFIVANGLRSNLVCESGVRGIGAGGGTTEAPVGISRPAGWRPRGKPRVCILADFPGWAYDISARELKRRLADQFRVSVRYVARRPRLSPRDYDLLHVCFWGETHYQAAGFARERIVKEVSSHRWQDDPRYGPCTPAEFARRYLGDCGTVICTSRRLAEIVGPVFPHARHTPNGIDARRFNPSGRKRNGPLVIGWAGNVGDPVKGLREIIEPACAGRFALQTATGGRRHREMAAFYRGIDVLAVASTHEGEPLTLLEAMASGCFPVCVDVGIVPELIEHKGNGYIVPERSIAAFRDAFDWCGRHVERVRTAGLANARAIAQGRDWNICAEYFRAVYWEALARAERPLFRNDDVSWDTSLGDFRRFCGAFHKYGQTQLHGVTLRGCTNAVHVHNGQEAEYPGFDTISRLDNATIRRLSDGKAIENRPDLIAYLNASADDVALHGLYHTDYSQMSADEQERDIGEGLATLRRLFPNKPIQHFIAPFNRTNADTFAAAARHGLTVLAEDGVHLEQQLECLQLEPGQWYRYHHHRFYPESRFRYYTLSIDRLEAALGRALSFRIFPPAEGKSAARERPWMAGFAAGLLPRLRRSTYLRRLGRIARMTASRILAQR